MKTNTNSKEDNFSRFKDFVLHREFPCIMSQSVFKKDNVTFHQFTGLGTATAAQNILKALPPFIASSGSDQRNFCSLVFGFPEEKISGEKEFEEKLWNQLQCIHDLDESAWDPSVSCRPQQNDFSFSVLKTAFYIVGMHPKSSRKARRSPFPVIVFNLHDQFDRLRDMNRYRLVRDKIRERDVAYQGSVNPMLEDFGHSSEARQYSGREVEKDWKCPFHAQEMN